MASEHRGGSFILAIDQGTTGTTVLAVSPELKVIAKHSCEFRQVFPRPGWVEHEASAIWQSVEQATKGCLESAGLDGKDIAAIGITNQRETTCLFDRHSEPLAASGSLADPEQRLNFIVWQCRRTADICNKMKADAKEPLVRQKTGLVLDPYFSGTKLRWYFDNIDGAHAKAAAGEALFGTIDSWLVHKLSGGAVHITDVTNASRTLLMNLETLAWDDELLEMFGVPRACLPAIKSSSEVYGKTRGVSFLPDGIPIAGIAGDQQAALFGQACLSEGEAKCTYGTGCFLLLNTGEKIVRSQHGLLTTVAIQQGGATQYALEGAAFIAGAAVQWLRDGLKLIDSAGEIEGLARGVSDSGDVVFVPALAGLGAPHWRSDARGLLAGLTRDTDRRHIARAVLEGIALQNRDILIAMRKDAGYLSVLKVDGGAAANDLLMQIQSDVLDVPCVRPEVLETTALGAAALAGLAIGMFGHRDDVRKVWREDKTFQPAMSDDARARMISKWERAVERA